MAIMPKNKTAENMGTIKILTHPEARYIAGVATELLEKLQLSAAIWITDRNGTLLTADVVGIVIPTTKQIARLKAEQSAYTADHTEVIAKKIETGERTLDLLGIKGKTFVSFAGGVPIYDSSDGTLLGAAGLSNLSAESDKLLITTAVEFSGKFTCKKPDLVVIGEAAMKEALSAVLTAHNVKL
jgi:uncharacterized protein GlcG (DUF336 family)